LFRTETRTEGPRESAPAGEVAGSNPP